MFNRYNIRATRIGSAILIAIAVITLAISAMFIAKYLGWSLDVFITNRMQTIALLSDIAKDQITKFLYDHPTESFVAVFAIFTAITGVAVYVFGTWNRFCDSPYDVSSDEE